MQTEANYMYMQIFSLLRRWQSKTGMLHAGPSQCPDSTRPIVVNTERNDEECDATDDAQ